MFAQGTLFENRFLSNITALRQDPGVPPDGSEDLAERGKSVQLLQSVLAAEITCVLRYTAISVSPDALRCDSIGAEFREQANDERRHMARVAARIEQLGGVPDFRNATLTAREYELGNYSLTKHVQENLAAERSIIDYYMSLIFYFSGFDLETAALLRDIVVDEENHTRDIEDLIGSYL